MKSIKINIKDIHWRAINKKEWVLFGSAVFILFIFIWGNVSLRQGKKTTHAADVQVTGIATPSATASGGNFDLDALTTSLLQNVTYATSLAEIDSDMAESMVSVDSDSTIHLYMGEGTCADELLLVRAKDGETAKEDQTAVEAHLKDMKQSFADYLPEEAKKVENAVIVRCGSYVIACVTADADQAKQIIVEAFQQ